VSDWWVLALDAVVLVVGVAVILRLTVRLARQIQAMARQLGAANERFAAATGGLERELAAARQRMEAARGLPSAGSAPARRG
jgi:uncharacterized membrane-anchored protein YhcB (DUF1043 family)